SQYPSRIKERIVAYTTNARRPSVVNSGVSHHRSVRRVRCPSATRVCAVAGPSPGSAASLRLEWSVLVTLITTHALVVRALPERGVVRRVRDLHDVDLLSALLGDRSQLCELCRVDVQAIHVVGDASHFGPLAVAGPQS